MELIDLVSSLRDLVSEYDEIITRCKLWIGRISSEHLNELKVFIKNIDTTLDKTIKLLSLYNSVKGEIGDDRIGKYIKTYYSYLKLVSIPYTRDLLDDIRVRIRRKNITVEKLDEVIAKADNILERF